MSSQALKVTLIAMSPLVIILGIASMILFLSERGFSEAKSWGIAESVTILGIGFVMVFRSLIMFANHTVTPGRQAFISSIGVCAAPFVFLVYSEVNYFTSVNHSTVAKVIDAGAVASFASGAILFWLALLALNVVRASRSQLQT